jgi:hypothetical protein
MEKRIDRRSLLSILFYFGLLHEGGFAQTVAHQNARNDRLFAK